MFTYPYLIIKKKLETDLPELKVVDWFLNQYSAADNSAMLLTCPAVYIQFEPMEVQAMGQKIQMAKGSVLVHLVTDSVRADGHRMAKTDAADHAVLFDGVYRAVDGLRGMLSEVAGFEGLAGTDDDARVFNSLSRDHIRPSHELRSKVVSVQRFKGVFYDHSKVKKYQKIAAGLQINTI